MIFVLMVSIESERVNTIKTKIIDYLLYYSKAHIPVSLQAVVDMSDTLIDKLALHWYWKSLNLGARALSSFGEFLIQQSVPNS